MIEFVTFSSSQPGLTYIVAAVGAPSKGIAKICMWVTDASFSAEHNPTLSNLC